MLQLGPVFFCTVIFTSERAHSESSSVKLKTLRHTSGDLTSKEKWNLMRIAIR